ncbi:hypothetical protein COJ67_30125 [Bacillus thuringiensis]|uniref:DUF3937 family protein n=1 Tax=Bacillus thuringiensis TaxID=1428 RepID=UPI000BF277C2|nr:DUF3937 family protein [Bacillus thuringiensis]MBE5096695.1 DUF3937 family protein [Bacillus thuringiensis]PFN81751.1 hypothetical protein COJ67_30125 [Bacillus thuringiensis]PGX91510.1 hypothetical protein COE41_28765 [Bacillus thuringiensis]
MGFERCYMFTNKKLIRIGLTIFVFLCIIDFSIGYFQSYLASAADIKWTTPEMWETILIDAPRGILVLLGAIALYDFTKQTSKKDASI